MIEATGRMPLPGDPSSGLVRARAVLAHGVFAPTSSDPLRRETRIHGSVVLTERGRHVWRVWACPGHLDGLTGIRQFGG